MTAASRARSLNLATADQYRQFVNEQIAAGNVDSSRAAELGSANTNWENEVTRTAIVQNHNFAFSGGTQSTQYRASLNYMNQEGVTRGSGFERFQGRLNGTQYAWDDRLQLRLNLTASHMNHDYVTFQDGGGFLRRTGTGTHGKLFQFSMGTAGCQPRRSQSRGRACLPGGSGCRHPHAQD